MYLFNKNVFSKKKRFYFNINTINKKVTIQNVSIRNMFHPNTLKTLAMQIIIDDEIPSNEVPQNIHHDICTLQQIKKLREEEEYEIKKVNILTKKEEKTEWEGDRYAWDGFDEKSKYCYELCYQMNVEIGESVKRVKEIHMEVNKNLTSLSKEYHSIEFDRNVIEYNIDE